MRTVTHDNLQECRCAVCDRVRLCAVFAIREEDLVLSSSMAICEQCDPIIRAAIETGAQQIRQYEGGRLKRILPFEQQQFAKLADGLIEMAEQPENRLISLLHRDPAIGSFDAACEELELEPSETLMKTWLMFTGRQP